LIHTILHMSLFKKPSVCIWPKSHSLEIFIDRKENNHFVFEFDLWQSLSDQDATSLHNFFKTISSKNVFLLLPEEVVTTKSFTYESSIDSLTKDEIVAMLSSVINFKVDPDYLMYKLEDSGSKTIIRVSVVDSLKIDILKVNFEKIGIKITDYQSISSSIVNTISQFYDKTYSLIYPTDPPQYLFILSKNNKIFLTDTIKGVSLDIKKKINYSKLYFGKSAEKLFIPSDFQTDLKVGEKVEKNPFDEAKISSKLGKSTNLPLPVLSFFDTTLHKQIKQTADIIKITKLESFQNKVPKMEDKKKKNPLVILLVFIASLSIVSAILWFLLNKQDGSIVSPTSKNQTPTSQDQIIPTQAPTATPQPVVDLAKDLKIRVLNATDINGQAATLKSELVDLDFEDISVGNSSQALTKNTVKYKVSIEGVEGYVTANLASFSQADFDDSLKDTDTYDIIFLIGQDLSTEESVQEPTETPAEE